VASAFLEWGRNFHALHDAEFAEDPDDESFDGDEGDAEAMATR
jgi:hypothetical protein